MSDNFLTFKSDFSSIQEALKQTSLNEINIQKKILREVGKKAARLVNKKLRATTHGNGMIAGRYPARLSFTYHPAKDGTKVSVYPKKIEPGRKNDLTVPVVYSLNYGNRIQAKRKFLTISGKFGFARPKNVQITARHFIDDGENYFNSGAFVSDAQAILNKELDKYWS